MKMKQDPKKNKRKINKSPSTKADKTGSDKDADKTGTDKNADTTESDEMKQDENKFDKPKRETDPDRTGIDKEADKTKKENIKTQQNFWLRNLGLQADTRYGTFDNFSTIANAGSTTLQSITNRQLNYGAGLFIKLPVFDVVNRKTQIKQAKAEMEQANYLQQAQADEIRQIVIRQYEELLLKQKLLSIRSQNLGSAIVNTQMVEKEFRNGVIPVFEYVRLSDMTSRIKSEYEMAKSEFIVSKKILEEIVGFSFKNPELSEK